jgi:tetratricopeptide (TPR) repeat protein
MPACVVLPDFGESDSILDVTPLAEAVLGRIRTRSDLYRLSAANRHGGSMHEAIDMLEEARPTTDPAEFYSVVHAALASAIKVIARADDSSGIIGDACRRLLEMHPQAAAAGRVRPSKLVDWMMTFQFKGDVDYFHVDPVAYAPALGEAGMADYRARLDALRATLGPKPSEAERWSVPDRYEWWVLDWNDQRLAILDRDVDAIIRTHARDRKVAAWLQDTAQAFEEIGDIERAIDWARQATDHSPSHQALRASDYWCQLLAQHRPGELVAARRAVFSRWPSSSTAASLYRDAARAWPELRDEVLSTLAEHPDQAVTFALSTLKDPHLAWELSAGLRPEDLHVWADLAEAYGAIDPIAVMPIHRLLVEHELEHADAKYYRRAAKRLAKMRTLAAGTEQADAVTAFIAELRDIHRRRPRLQQEFDRARLP